MVYVIQNYMLYVDTTFRYIQCISIKFLLLKLLLLTLHYYLVTDLCVGLFNAILCYLYFYFRSKFIRLFICLRKWKNVVKKQLHRHTKILRFLIKLHNKHTKTFLKLKKVSKLEEVSNIYDWKHKKYTDRGTNKLTISIIEEGLSFFFYIQCYASVLSKNNNLK